MSNILFSFIFSKRKTNNRLTNSTEKSNFKTSLIRMKKQEKFFPDQNNSQKSSIFPKSKSILRNEWNTTYSINSQSFHILHKTNNEFIIDLL